MDDRQMDDLGRLFILWTASAFGWSIEHNVMGQLVLMATFIWTVRQIVISYRRVKIDSPAQDRRPPSDFP